MPADHRRLEPEAVTATVSLNGQVAAHGVIVVCGMPFGGSPPFGDTHLARALATMGPVLVVDVPRPVHRAGRRPALAPLEDRPGSWVLRPTSLPGSARCGASWLSDPLIAAQVERAARRVLPDDRVLITFTPARGSLVGVRRRLLVYWRRDLAGSWAYPGSAAHQRHRHKRLLERADLVTSVSPVLAEDSRRANANVHLVPNGADIEHFDVGVRPLRWAPGPVVGYVGAVNWRVDLDLVDHVARTRPDWRVLLVGAVDRRVTLPRQPNLDVVGAVSYADLPAWVRGFDAGLVPYADNAFNRACFPLKVFDYLASGVPVVSTALPALVDLGPALRTAGEPDAFVRALDDTLAARPDESACRALAEANAWVERARTVDRLIRGTLRARATELEVEERAARQSRRVGVGS